MIEYGGCPERVLITTEREEQPCLCESFGGEGFGGSPDEEVFPGDRINVPRRVFW